MVIVTAQTACTIYWSLVTDSLSLYKHLKNLFVDLPAVAFLFFEVLTQEKREGGNKTSPLPCTVQPGCNNSL